ncbi:MAG: MerR family transcriptional regulator [Thermodesulfobacteriota bacterium]
MAMTVGRLARRFGLSRSTLLYYDRLGLLRPSGRSSGDYRLYEEADVARLEAVCRYRAAGFSLADIAALLDAPADGLAGVLTRRIAELDREMEALREQQGFLFRLLPGALGARGAASRRGWVKLLERAGFGEADMVRWHRDFERLAPEQHQAFLESLGLAAEDIAFIRTASREAAGGGD